jgi:hypothetical protein
VAAAVRIRDVVELAATARATGRRMAADRTTNRFLALYLHRRGLANGAPRGELQALDFAFYRHFQRHPFERARPTAMIAKSSRATSFSQQLPRQQKAPQATNSTLFFFEWGHYIARL